MWKLSEVQRNKIKEWASDPCATHGWETDCPPYPIVALARCALRELIGANHRQVAMITYLKDRLEQKDEYIRRLENDLYVAHGHLNGALPGLHPDHRVADSARLDAADDELEEQAGDGPVVHYDGHTMVG